VVVAHEHPEALAAHDQRAQPGRVGRAAHERGVEWPAQHGVGQLDRGQHERADRDLSEPRAQRLDEPRRRLVGAARRIAEAELAARAGGERAQALPQRIGVALQARAVLEEVAARGGRLDALRGALEQGDTELALEQADLAADRGLGNVQRLGGPAELRSRATARK
jgi:hypothetical protein